MVIRNGVKASLENICPHKVLLEFHGIHTLEKQAAQ